MSCAQSTTIIQHKIFFDVQCSWQFHVPLLSNRYFAFCSGFFQMFFKYAVTQSVCWGKKKRGLTRIRRINHCSDEFMQINFKEHVPPMIVNYYAICRDMSNHKSNPFCRRKKNNPSIRWFDKKSGIHRVRNPSRRSCWLCLILIGWFLCFLSRRHANVTAESEKSEINRIHSSSESQSDAIAIFDSEH